jgi:hypothetical protein
VGQIILIGVALLVAILLINKPKLITNPKLISKHFPHMGAIASFTFAVLSLLYGRFFLAIPAFLLGYYLLGRIRLPWLWTHTSNTRNGRSTIRTPMLELVYERRTGYMDGLIRSGRYGGRRLSELSRSEMEHLLAEAQSRDTSTATLLEGYIRHMQSGGKTGFQTNDYEEEYVAEEPRNARNARVVRSNMTRGEAFDVLGLKPGASRGEIQKAHRDLMKRYHPDHGGSTYLATKINEAKDVLLG